MCVMQKTIGWRAKGTSFDNEEFAQNQETAGTAIRRRVVFSVHALANSATGEGRSMSIFSVGRMCVKLAGRDAGRKCVVVEKIDGQFVVVDGHVRRRKVNVKHLEPLNQILNLKEKATSAEVKAAFEKMGLAVWETKQKKTAPRPSKQKKGKKETERIPEKAISGKTETKETKKKAPQKTKEEKND